jgi:hypothetical protein
VSRKLLSESLSDNNWLLSEGQLNANAHWIAIKPHRAIKISETNSTTVNGSASDVLAIQRMITLPLYTYFAQKSIESSRKIVDAFGIARTFSKPDCWASMVRVSRPTFVLSGHVHFH